MFGSPRKLPRISRPGPRITSCWCSINQHTSLAADAVSEALGWFWLQSSQFNMQAESSNTNFMGFKIPSVHVMTTLSKK
jgi:hypothetical protein